MHTNVPAPDTFGQIQALTREYSRYSRSAGGLSAVIGGVACLVSYLAGALLPASVALRVALIAMPLLWLAVKQWLAHRYYQRFGHVEELAALSERRYQIFFIGFTALVSVMVAGFVLRQLTPLGERPWDLRVVGYLAVVLVLPVVVWRWLRTPLEFIVGVFLLCQAAVAFAGRTYGFSPMTVAFPVAAVALIVAGLRDHWRFVRLQAELHSIIAARSPME